MSLKILIGTYNLNQRLIEQDLTSWLFSSQGKPDIIAVGFQEFNEYPNAFLNINNENRLKHCEEKLENAIYGYTKERYFRIVRSVLVGLVLVIYVRDEEVISRMKSIEIEQVGIGPLWASNKGAIAVRLIISTGIIKEKFRDTISVCFVCAHLAPHSHNSVKRNENFKSIIERVIFTNKREFTSLLEDNNNKNEKYIMIYDNDYVFFFGDLNYRIEMTRSRLMDLMDLMNSDQYQSALPFDQLNIEKSKGQTFNGFQEGEIKFPPTYKYYVGTINSFNTSKRIPGWCDRILYLSKLIDANNEMDSIILNRYTSDNDYTISDHKPVSALFTINFNFVPIIRSYNFNFKIDNWRFVKKFVGNVTTKLFGSLWWLFGTRRGIALTSILTASIFIAWHFFQKQFIT